MRRILLGQIELWNLKVPDIADYIEIAVTTVVTGGAAADLARVVASGALTETVAQVAQGEAIGGVSGVIYIRNSTGAGKNPDRHL